MSRTVPPLNPLRVFECAARQGSFTRAAEELLVSQSAVSRQVNALEEYLGIKLFIREQNGVVLTPQGARYQSKIGPAFAAIASATREIRFSAASEPLKLKVYSTFAGKWLIRRLSDFHEKYPDIEVNINTDVAPVDFGKDGVDAAIQFGDGNWEELHVELLFDDVIEPVCSPALLAMNPPMREPVDLLRCCLLLSRYRRVDWHDWLSSVGITVPPEQNQMTFPSSLLTYQAAIDGLGVAIGQLHMLQEELKTGTLVAPFDKPLRRKLAHFFVYPKSGEPPRKLRIFLDWLRLQVASESISRSAMVE